MELKEKVEGSITEWSECWDRMSVQSNKPIIKISRIRQIWNYIRIRHITKKCYKSIDPSLNPEEIMPLLEKDVTKLAQILLGVKRMNAPR